MRIGISTSVIQRGKSGVGQYVFALLRALESISTLPPERARPGRSKPLLTGGAEEHIGAQARANVAAPADGRAPQHKLVLFVLEEDLPLFAFAKDKAELVAVPEKFRPPVKNILWHQMRLPKLARNLQLDVLHIPSYRRMLWSRPCPLVSTIHDLASFHVAEKYDWKRMFYGRVIARRLAQRQNQIIAISQYTARDIEKFFRLSRERISVVHNGLDHERFHPGSREEAISGIAKRFGLKHPFFLYVSRLEHPGKNHVRLISAFEEFKTTFPCNWQLALAGGDWHGAEVIHEAIRKSKFTNDIRSLGFVPDGQLPELYRAADVFVYPSLHEGFGLPPIEAMACGCPVITSTRGALAEVVGDAAAIIEPEDVQSIADKLRLLAGVEGERNRLKTIGVEHARKFDWNKTAAETLKVYESVAADVKRRTQ